jgi:hypothetical protein
MTTTSDLSSIFQLVQNSLEDNRDLINQADDLHHDHGDNMVEIFNTITNAIQAKQDATPDQQLNYASKALKKSVKSGTAKEYAKGLAQASKQFTGKEINTASALDFIQLLLGGQASTVQEEQAEPENPLGGLLSALTGTGETQQNTENTGFDLADILQMGMGYLQAKESGSSPIEAIASAVLSNTPMGKKQHRAASGKVVSQSLLNAFLNQMNK